MTSPPNSTSADCTIVGASFAGLACATLIARRGLRVRVLERKHDPGEQLHTTGIIVKEVVDQLRVVRGSPDPALVRDRRSPRRVPLTPPATGRFGVFHELG